MIAEMKLLASGVVLAASAGCGAAKGPWEPNSPPETLAERIEAIHGIDAWQGKKAVAVDLVVVFGGQAVISGAMVYEHHTGRVRIDVPDGPTLVFDGKRAWVSPASAEVPMARFHLLTWPYFLAAPFKLRDPGSRLERWPPGSVEGALHYCARLEFEPGVGDTPDDWYILYADRQDYRLAAMTYIVTYGRPLEREPHAIIYEDFVRRDGVLLSQRWRFLNWSEADGPHGEPIGEVVLSNLRFVTPEAGTFERPPDSREDVLPES